MGAPRVLALPLVLCLCAGLSCGGKAEAVRRAPASLRIGVVANTLDLGSSRGAELDLVRRSGASWVREEFRWFLIEPSRGRFRWGAYDALVSQAARRGLHVLPLLLGTPPWAGPARLALSARAGDFGRFGAAVAARYGPGGGFWRSHRRLDSSLAVRDIEIWNEPYYMTDSTGGVNPGAYARLVKAAGSAGHRANAGVRWLLEADTTYISRQNQVRPWLDDLYRAVPDLNRYYDAVAVHPYSDGSPLDYTPPNSRGQFRRIDEVLADLGAHHATARPLWVTEVGWPTCPAGPRCVTEREQARYLGELFGLLTSRYASTIDAVFVYRLRDLDPAIPGDREQWFGLTHRDGSPKPAFDAFAQITGAEAGTSKGR